jgi:hypothetical protein
MMETFVLPRTGKPPLELHGKQLCAVSTEKHEDPRKFERWYQIALYEASDGSYVSQVALCSTWTREAPGHTEVLSFPSLPLLFQSLALYDPCLHCTFRPERTEQETKVNGPKNEMVRKGLFQEFQGLIQQAANAIKYQEVSDTNVRNSQTLLQVWVENDLLSAIEKKRGTHTLEDITHEALRAWTLAQE